MSGLLAQGHIIGWVQGNCEFSTKGLGNRSILADPRKLSVREGLQLKLERNQVTLPFGASVLHESGPTYFIDYQNSPYMEKALLLKEETHSLGPGITQKKKPIQVHSVHKELNPLFHSLIKEFYALTKIPLILNTSLNSLSKSPLIKVEDFLSLLLTTNLETLVLGNFIVKRRKKKII